MSTQRKMRAEKRAAMKDPKNYTCGECHQVHKFDSKHPYECANNIKTEARETTTGEGM